ncbi:MAG: phosphoglyceromutase, phosphoglycerate mutase [Microgenomates group bacterium GW2011_GWC1_39_7b]|uniref:2,3-bisphosphoglycerate-independent phosphoglycerate mutase n=3 Tax=Candidatus Woeseibacteriota TaxID=1752722 RepID=A0A0G0P0R8_9BACT|nr:MAG: 2,3-bisphosphoglycerate-independent phosphoglycerate mutase [Candidatus Woesebacteria bacterium GW2011_GWB1_39_10]KKR26408.1 MAG: phosphoglyceromutase, phosphoglycerate mutase [Microgenomates group bacterium GW2011_GWC1_39_7b]KKS90671.1 MAG: 2,3-bisphosphoglycerate-independent phosphoglycerate mutase [Candidatus Woesebacteria bacterium GW2011_GWA1_43_12]
MGQTPPKFVMLVVLDGWGISAAGPGNAITQAETPNMDRFIASFPHTQLGASGESVGLPRGEVGNTETGHLNLGAGRIVYQDLQKINMSIADGNLFQNQILIGAIDHARTTGGNLHFMGLVGAGGVHSNIEHLFALIDLAKRHEFNRVFLHLFIDGRDSPPTAAKTYISQIRKVITDHRIGQIATIMGRYWAMDRDLRWDRTAKAYFALTKGEGHFVKTPEEAIDNSYAEGRTDEFLEPSIITSTDGKPLTVVKANDSVIFFNFRIDRPRQLSRAFLFDDFALANTASGFDPYQVKYAKSHLIQVTAPLTEPFLRGPKLANLYFVTMTEYDKPIVAAGAKVAFPPEVVRLPLGAVISESGYKQLRSCESEKERFVTFYFNGQQESAFPGEDRLIISSPKVATYDLIPEMSARTVTENVLAKMKDFPDYKFILINFANPDMVGHTGNIGAGAKACQIVDECLGKLYDHITAYNGFMIVTSDHGNCEQMIDSQTGEIETEHSANPVPFIAISKYLEGKPVTLTSGILADVAPTVLNVLGIQVPGNMTGRNLLESLV